MSVVVFTLRQRAGNSWEIVGPKGNVISGGGFCGTRYEAELWARAWISSWHDSVLEVEATTVKAV